MIFCPLSAVPGRVSSSVTADLRAKIQDFSGLDSRIILILMGGILMSIGNFPESLGQAILVGIILVGRFGHLSLRPPDITAPSHPRLDATVSLFYKQTFSFQNSFLVILPFNISARCAAVPQGPQDLEARSSMRGPRG